MSTRNPYVNAGQDSENDTPDYAPPHNAYAVPSSGAPYGLPGAPYADVLSYERGATPDPTRVMRDDITDARQDPIKPKKWWRRRSIEQDERESVQSQRGQILSEQETSAPVVPRATGIGTPLRVTASLSPSTYSFSRPMTGGIPKHLNGIHFSMADHARYPGEIFGMAPAHQPRQTYRADVAGWSEGDVDRVIATDEQYTYTVPTVPSTQRSYRLD